MATQNQIDAAFAAQALVKGQAAALATTAANTKAKAKTWLESLGTKFIDVHFLLRDGSWWAEEQVLDAVTLPDTIDMTASSKGARAAVWLDFDAITWCCQVFKAVSDGELTHRRFPNKEAAEMYALHKSA